MLIDRGADVGAVDDGSGATALHLAAENGRVDVMKFLLEKGADINYKNKRGHTALTLVSPRGFADAVELLVSHGADVLCKTEDDWAAIHFAYKNEKITRILLQNKADVNQLSVSIVLKSHNQLSNLEL